MKVNKNKGVVASILFSPFEESDNQLSLRSELFDETIAECNVSFDNRLDIYDESFLTFPNIDDAIFFLVNFLRKNLARAETFLESFTLRGGICVGDFYISNDHIYGDAVNNATKLSCSSRENEILLIYNRNDQIIHSIVEQTSDISVFTRNPEENCFSIGLKDDDATTLQQKNHLFEIIFNDQTRIFQRERNKKILIGRADTVDVYIDSDVISRKHATITINDTSLELTDHSANGTYFINNAGKKKLLVNESIELPDSGIIICGHTRVNTSDIDKISNTIKYRVFDHH